MTTGSKPLLCVVTDRRIVEGKDREARVTRLVAAAAAAGVAFVQIRQRALEAGDLLRLVTRCCDVARGSRTRLLVNERLDVALAAGAHGVHLRGDSLPAHRARRAVPAGFVIGRSVHSAQEAREVAAAGGVDYLLLGTVFPSRSKPDAAPLGEAELARAVAAVSVPVLAIGGIDLERCAAVARTGAAGIAAIGLFGQDDSADPVTRLRDIVARVQEAFDTQRAVP